MTSREPRRIIIDTGPLIGVMYEEDAYHTDAARGVRQLVAARTQVLVLVPILSEVYKRLAYDVGLARARQGLTFMRAALILNFVGSDDLDRVQELIDSMPWWGGSLEDALLVMTGLERDVPVWTYNYRDLKAFPNLAFWTPA